MNPLTQCKNAAILAVLIALTLGCFGLSPQALAVDPPPDRGYPNQNSAENEDALESNVTGSDNAPASWIWRGGGRLNIPRINHTATLLADGRVLVAGGYNLGNVFNSCELYDPASGTWTYTGVLHTYRWDHAATLLQNGMVLVAAGINGSFFDTTSAELYDPASGTWTVTNSLKFARDLHTATLLGNGRVLIAGGGGPNNINVKRAELGARSR